MEKPRSKTETLKKRNKREKRENTSAAPFLRKTITRVSILSLLIVSTGIIIGTMKPKTSSSTNTASTPKKRKPLNQTNESLSARFNQFGQHYEKDPTKATELFGIITKHLKVNEEKPLNEELFLALGRDLLENQTFHNILNKHRKNPRERIPVSLETITIFLNPTLLRMSPAHIIYIDTSKGTIGLFQVSSNAEVGQK